MRQRKSLSNYESMYKFLLRNENVILHSVGSKENIKENFKYFLYVNVHVKETSKNVFIISLNRSYFINEQVKSVEEIIQLANEGKAVYVTLWKRTSPATFLASWQARLLHSWIKAGNIYTITKKESNEKQKG